MRDKLPDDELPDDELPDELTVGGIRPLVGRLCVPGDKSISHRALLLAALGDGRSTITHAATGDDVGASRSALVALGVHVDDGPTGTVVVDGVGFGGLREPESVLDCGNSGTTIRLLAGVLAGQSFLSVLTGDASLRSRPMARVATPLRAMGAHIDGRNNAGYAPLAIRGGALRGIDTVLPVASAQVKSAIVFAALQAEGPTTITSPAPTRDHTERLLVALGARMRVDGLRVHVEAGPTRAFDLEIPGDPSSAAFFVVAASITPGSEIVLEGVACNPTRLGFVDVLRRMGASIDVNITGDRSGEPVGDMTVRYAPLGATTIGGDEIPNVQDEIPALAVAAAFAEGVTEIHDASELAVKESNRIGTVHQELTKLGIAVETRPDGLVIRGGRPRPALLESHGDHRIAMAAAIAANAIDGASTVQGWRAVSSSYPEFATDFAALTDRV